MYSLYTTMLINLKKTEEELWTQIHKSLRTEVRKAEKMGLMIEYNPSPEQLEQAYQLYLRMMKKKYIPVESSYKLWNSEKTKIILALYEGKVVSYIQFFLSSPIDLWKNTLICALETIANDDEYRSLCWNSFLYRKGILYMKSLWFEYLNFNGVSYQGGGDFSSLAFFKRKWNGIEITCVSEKNILSYFYRKYFRKYAFVQKIVYIMLLRLFPKRFLRY